MASIKINSFYVNISKMTDRKNLKITSFESLWKITISLLKQFFDRVKNQKLRAKFWKWNFSLFSKQLLKDMEII